MEYQMCCLSHSWLYWKGYESRLDDITCYLSGTIESRNKQGVRWIHWSFFSGIFLLGGSHLWHYLVNMGTSIIWCDSNIKVQYFSVWLWYTLSQNLRERLQEFKSQLFHCFVFILTDNFFNAVDCNSVVNF